MTERFLTVGETARLTAFSEVSIRRWISQGLLEVERIGPHRRIRIRASVVQRFFPNVDFGRDTSSSTTTDHPV